MSDLFKKVHERLRDLIRSSHEGKMQKHYRWLDSLLQQVQKHVLVRIQFANDGSKSNNEVKQGLEKLQRFVLESKTMKEDLKQQAYARCTHMVLLIETHLNQKTVKRDIKCRFYANINMNLSNDNINEIRAKGKRYIQGIILEEIQKWELDSKHYQRTVSMLNAEFEKKFQS
ncbi:hypothetical protein DPMN_155545 [Dreissena polymorpha]|uniref:Uncharacterized protein n=1 Tax=Dreissena polymorpha TaxID=45954 RepID=A0A9D4FRE5_DREPO|nr:hypothetical protein DPMN_155545 [Dreissena polymorpha]